MSTMYHTCELLTCEYTIEFTIVKLLKHGFNSCIGVILEFK